MFCINVSKPRFHLILGQPAQKKKQIKEPIHVKLLPKRTAQNNSLFTTMANISSCSTIKQPWHIFLWSIFYLMLLMIVAVTTIHKLLCD